MTLNIKRTSNGVSFITAVTALLIGLLLISAPGTVVGILSFALGLICILWGASRLIRALRSRTGPLGIFAAVLALVFGFQVWWNPARVLSLLPIAAGFFFIYDGIDRVRTALARRPGSGSYLSRMGGAGILGLVLILAGMWLILFPMGALEMLLRIIGILILLDSIGDLWQLWQGKQAGAARAKSQFHADDGTYEAEYRDITDDN